MNKTDRVEYRRSGGSRVGWTETSTVDGKKGQDVTTYQRNGRWVKTPTALKGNLEANRQATENREATEVLQTTLLQSVQRL